MASLYKLKINKWALQPDLKVNICIAMLSQQVAVGSETVFQLMQAMRDGKFDQHLPARPPKDEWFALYHNHRAVTLAVGDCFPQAFGNGRQIQDKADAARALGVLARNNPEEYKRQLKKHGDAKLLWKFPAKLGLLPKVYKRHLKSLQRELTVLNDDDGADQFDRALHESAAFYFYIRICLPCVCAYQMFPLTLLRRASRPGPRQEQAIEQLVRLDDRAIHFDAIEQWHNSVGGMARILRGQMLRQWADQGLDTGRFTCRQLKELMGGLIAAVVNLHGDYWEFGRRGIHRPHVTAAHIRGLFDAVAQDKAERKIGNYDTDLADIQAESWQRAIRKSRRLWEQVLSDGGGSKSPSL